MKRILSSILAVALVLSLVAPGIFVSASAATGVQGDGTKENPYIIKNEADFAFSTRVRNISMQSWQMILSSLQEERQSQISEESLMETDM